MLRGIEAEFYHSDWDPDLTPVDVGNDSIMLAARFMVEGLVTVKIWKGKLETRLPYTIHAGILSHPRKVLVIHDPNEEVRMEFRGEGAVRVAVDDVDLAERVDIVLFGPAQYA
ncbi:hypothetical protein RM572_25265 [Streptomyces sp. DSM 42041]|uniref:Uncharacterized protein n=1 Tax=Streptomyces hazeniae TaxID=3075538 RepID=A0ABU2NZG5_9ACTN|nr:hypothetical protein [Streptomyces sp. DSM 42041]MDT0382075.1 hypothetical protein [Streptomyces sp. DSM 42041]